MLTWIFDIGLLVVAAWVVWIWRKTAYVPKTRHVCVLAWDSGQGVEILGATPSTLDATRGDEIFWDVLCNVDGLSVSIDVKDSPLESPNGSPKTTTRKHGGGKTKPDKIKKTSPNRTCKYTITVGNAVLDPEIRIRDEEQCP